MSNCVIKGCPASRRVKEHVTNQYSLHRFPNNVETRKQWLSICGLEENNSQRKCWRICNRHFPSQHFKTDSRGRKALKSGAVPSLFLNGLPQHQYTIMLPMLGNEHNFFIAQLDNGIFIKITYENDLSPYPNVIEGYTEIVTNSNMTPTSITDETNRLKEIIKSCRKAKALKIKKDKQKQLYDSVKWKALGNKVKMLQDELRRNKAESKIMCETAKSKVLQSFESIFSPTQIKMILSKQKKAMWTEEDISKGISLRTKSTSCYRIVRDVYKIPLPGVSTLKRYCQKIEMLPGIQFSVLNLLKQEFLNFNPQDRLAMFSFDEMSIDSSACYDRSKDKIYGQQKNLTLAVVRGLLPESKWKQPVYFSFEEMTVERIFEIIRQCYSFGVIVKGLICDLGRKNRGLWNKLGIKLDKTYIFHPVTGKKIWIFPDYPHLIKLCRNNLLDYGFTLSSKQKVEKSDLERLIKTDSNEFRIQYKLSEYHLNLKGRERQRVLAACQLFSGRTSTACLEVLPEKPWIAEFIQLINDTFDLMNSRTPDEKDPKKSPYGLHLDAQDALLDKMHSEMLNMRVNTKKTKGLFPFQKGYLISISSLKGMYKELQEDFNVKYILTHRLNQDVLENAFSVIRANGAYSETPNAVDVKSRIKSLMLGWNVGKIATASVGTEDTFNFMSYKLLSPLIGKINIQDAGIDENVFDELSITDLEEIEDSTWTETVLSMDKKEKCDFYGQEYAAGFILIKLQEKDPKMFLTNTNRQPHSFTENMSKVSLTVPSYTFLNTFMQFEQVFLHLFREKGDKYGLYRGEKVMKTLQQKITELFPDVSEKLIGMYAKTRIFIRIKYINTQLNSKKCQRRNKIMHFLRSHVPDSDEIENIDNQLMSEEDMRQEWNDLFGASETEMLADWDGV